MPRPDDAQYETWIAAAIDHLRERAGFDTVTVFATLVDEGGNGETLRYIVGKGNEFARRQVIQEYAEQLDAVEDDDDN